MAKSNITKKANVYIRRPGTPLLLDKGFLSQVRGLKATQRLLHILGVLAGSCRHDDPQIIQLVRQGKLTTLQYNSLRWEIPCSKCNKIPIGFTFKGHVEFRCEQRDCLGQGSRAHRLLVPDWALSRNVRPDEALTWAVRELRGKLPVIDLNAELRYPLALRIDPTLDGLYSTDELTRFLVYGMQHVPA